MIAVGSLALVSPIGAQAAWTTLACDAAPADPYDYYKTSQDSAWVPTSCAWGVSVVPADWFSLVFDPAPAGDRFLCEQTDPRGLGSWFSAFVLPPGAGATSSCQSLLEPAAVTLTRAEWDTKTATTTTAAAPPPAAEPGAAEPIRKLRAVVATDTRDQAKAIAPAAFALLIAGVMVTLGVSLMRRVV